MRFLTPSLERCLGCLAIFLLVVSCEEKKEEKVSVAAHIRPNLPKVPKIPPPEHPITYSDGSYSLYGARKKARLTIDHEIDVTGYIVRIYESSPCDKQDEDCTKPAAPHVWIADKPGENAPDKLMVITGYADNEKALRRAIAGAGGRSYVSKGDKNVPTDFAVGHRIKVSGQFTRVTSNGFSDSGGLIEYKSHETLSTQ